MAETVAQRIARAVADAGPEAGTARFDAELLMAHAIGCTRSDLLLRHLREESPSAFEPLIARYSAHEPVAYIMGCAEFYGLPLAVTRDVLIPRADSECLIEAARNAFKAAPPASVLDCGVGSGALLLAALSVFPDARGVGMDRSPEALSVASCNALSLRLEERTTFEVRDWDQPGWSDDLGRFDLVLANPPYVEDEAMLDSSVRDFEPAGALFAGAEGLDAYRVLIPQLPGLLAPGGTALVEIGSSQAGPVGEIAASAGLSTTLHRDLAGRPRCLQISQVGKFSLGNPSGNA